MLAAFVLFGADESATTSSAPVQHNREIISDAMFALLLQKLIAAKLMNIVALNMILLFVVAGKQHKRMLQQCCGDF